MQLHGNRFIVIGGQGWIFTPTRRGNPNRRRHAFLFACLGGSSAKYRRFAITKLGAARILSHACRIDAIGRFALNELDRYGIGRAHVRSVGGEARNSLAVVETRIEDHQSVIYRNGAADFEMTMADVEAVVFMAATMRLITTGTVFAAEPSRSAAFRAF